MNKNNQTSLTIGENSPIVVPLSSYGRGREGSLRGGHRIPGKGFDKAPLIDTHYFNQCSLRVSKGWYHPLVHAGVEKEHIDRVKNCNSEGIFLAYSCPSTKNDHFHTNVRPYSPCNDPYCLYCMGRYGKRKGVDIFHKLKAIPSRYYGHFVFTIPAEFWDPLFNRKMANRLKKVSRESLVEYFDLMVGGIHRVHVWGDKKVEYIGRREIHSHVLIPLLGFDKKKRVVRISRFRRDLAKLRGIYKKNFCAEFGVSFEGEINVNYSYKDKISSPEKLMNVCQYICRPPLEVPLRKGFEKISQFGVARLSTIVEKFAFYEGYRSLTWFGWLANGVVSGYLQKLKFTDKEVSSFFVKPKNGNCPICGLKMELVGVYYRNKLVMWKGKDPPGELEGIERVVEVSRGLVRVRVPSSGFSGWGAVRKDFKNEYVVNKLGWLFKKYL